MSYILRQGYSLKFQKRHSTWGTALANARKWKKKMRGYKYFIRKSNYGYDLYSNYNKI